MYNEFQHVMTIDDDPYLPKLTSGTPRNGYNVSKLSANVNTRMQVYGEFFIFETLM